MQLSHSFEQMQFSTLCTHNDLFHPTKTRLKSSFSRVKSWRTVIFLILSNFAPNWKHLPRFSQLYTVYLHICLFHLLVQKYFDHAQIFLTVSNIFWTSSKCFDRGQKVIFYLINLHIWAWSKSFECSQFCFWTSRWIRQ